MPRYGFVHSVCHLVRVYVLMYWLILLTEASAVVQNSKVTVYEVQYREAGGYLRVVAELQLVAVLYSS